MLSPLTLSLVSLPIHLPLSSSFWPCPLSSGSSAPALSWVYQRYAANGRARKPALDNGGRSFNSWSRRCAERCNTASSSPSGGTNVLQQRVPALPAMQKSVKVWLRMRASMPPWNARRGRTGPCAGALPLWRQPRLACSGRSQIPDASTTGASAPPLLDLRRNAGGRDSMTADD
jgi:hypothetical protein